MDVITIVVPAVVGAASAALVAYINKRKTKADIEKIAAETASVEVETFRVSLETASGYIAKLQKRVNELEAKLDVERAWRRKLERKFDAVIAWVRIVAPDADVNGFLARLEAGQGG